MPHAYTVEKLTAAQIAALRAVVAHGPVTEVVRALPSAFGPAQVPVVLEVAYRVRDGRGRTCHVEAGPRTDREWLLARAHTVVRLLTSAA